MATAEFTYTGLPGDNVVDAVRFLTGDTDSSLWLLSDQEIQWLDLTWGNKNSVYYTASMAAEAIAAKFAKEVNVSSDSQTASTSELQQKYLDLAGRLMRQHQTLLSGGFVDVGGINAGEQPDQTVTPPAFGMNMHDDISAGQQNLGDVSEALSYPWQWGWGEYGG